MTQLAQQLLKTRPTGHFLPQSRKSCYQKYLIQPRPYAVPLQKTAPALLPRLQITPRPGKAAPEPIMAEKPAPKAHGVNLPSCFCCKSIGNLRAGRRTRPKPTPLETPKHQGRGSEWLITAVYCPTRPTSCCD